MIAGRFVLEKEVAAGASGVVYRARDTHAGGAVALKLFHRDLADEAARLARLAGPGVSRYVAHGAVGGRGWLASEWIEGPTLEGSRPLAEGEVLALARRVAGALAEAHRRGIVHGDVKPANLILAGGDAARARLVDFGGGGGSLPTQAPEQRRGEPASPRSDVYALARVLAGCGPTPPTVRPLLERMLAEDPGRRPADGAAVLAELDALAPRPFAAERRVVAPPAELRPPLVGRERELELLERTLAGSRAEGVSRAVLIVARAGMGKTALLAELAAAPDLIRVDDLHREPPARVEELGRLLGERRVTVIAAARPEVHDRFPDLWPGAAVHELPLPPLPRRAALRLAPPHVVERAGGNPLLLHELPRGDGPLPPRVRALLETRLDEASPEARRALRAASTAGAPIDPAALAALLHDPPAVVAELLDELVRRELLVATDGGLGFADPLLAEAVRGTLPP